MELLLRVMWEDYKGPEGGRDLSVPQSLLPHSASRQVSTSQPVCSGLVLALQPNSIPFSGVFLTSMLLLELNRSLGHLCVGCKWVLGLVQTTGP